MRDLSASRSPAHLGAAAAAELLAGRAPHAIALLEEAVAAAPGEACLWSDLSAAHLLRAVTGGPPGSDLILALSAADHARRLAPSLGEAQVNLALSLENLALAGEARKAWCRAAGLAPTAAWRRQLDLHCHAVDDAAPRPEAWRRQRAILEDAAARGDRPTVEVIVQAEPQLAREWVLDEIFPQWGTALLDGRAAAARRALRIARGVGDALTAESHDWTVADAVRAIDGAAPADLARCARAHIDYAAGRRSYQASDFDPAAALLRRAAADLDSSGSPLARWSRLWLAGIAVQRADHVSARTALRTLLDDPGNTRAPVLAGLAHWLLGVSYVRTGSFAAGLENYREAAICLAATHEEPNLGGIASLTAEVLDYLGESRESWNLRYQALMQLAGYPASVQRQNLLRDSARVIAAAAMPESALHFWNESLLAAERAANPALIVHTLLQRCRLAGRLGDDASALADLLAARQESARLGDPFMRARLGADLAVATAELDAERPAGPGQERLAALSAAIDLYDSHHLDLEIVPALLVRAHLALRSGAEDQAEADLRRGIEIFEAQRSVLADPELRLSILDTATRLFDEMILFQAVRRHDAALAFEYAERARTSLAGLPNPAATSLRGAKPERLVASVSAALSRRAVQTVVLEYAVLPDDLLIWRVEPDGYRLVVRHGDTGALRQLTQRFLQGLWAGASAADLEPVAAALYDRLILPVEAPAGGGLTHDAELVVVPDRFLNGLPFGALWDRRSRRFLLEAHAVSLCPQASILALRRAPRAGVPAHEATALLVGDPASDRALFPWLPALRSAAEEVSRIAGLYCHAVVLTGAAPTRERFLDALRRAIVLHFAGHALPSDDDPAAAQLVLAASAVAGDPATVSGRDLLAETLPRLRLVVLSACGSAVPDASRTGGLFGLARPFLAAGAGAVVGTLWKVDDNISLSILPAFHRLYLEGGSAAQALRTATLPLTRAPTGAPLSPSRWAAFSVIQEDASFNESTTRREP